MTITDLLQAKPPVPDLYSKIKERLISNFSISVEARLRLVLKGVVPGDGKPSIILNKIKNLSQDRCSEEVIRTVFLDQLSTGCRVALAVSGITETAKLAEMADRFMEASD